MHSIIRLTRHEADDTQSDALRKIWYMEFSRNGIEEIEIDTISEKLPADPRQAINRFDELTAGAQIVEAVLPINILQAVMEHSSFVNNGGIIVRAVMIRILDDSGNAQFVFDGYERIVKVVIETQKYY